MEDKKQRRIEKKLRKKLRKQNRNPNFKTEYSFLKILTGSDLSQRKLPRMSVKSASSGPVIWLVGCIHGDEVGGMVVIQEIFKRLRKKPLLRGEIYALPLMNPLGFETVSRGITFTKEDLNRSFPGNKEGSLAERIAYKIFNLIKEKKPFFVLDLHNDWRKSIPYVLLDQQTPKVKQDVYELTKKFSKKIGFPVILDTGDAEKTLTYNLMEQGIPALSLELGESYVVNERDIEYGVKAIWSILFDLGMVEQFEEPIDYRLAEEIKNKVLKYSQEPVSPTSGIIRFLAKPGEIVKKGQPIAKTYNAFGKLLETIKALHNGIVLGYSDSSVAFPGAPIMAFGVIE